MCQDAFRHEGRVLIMTANHIKRLDPALVRPGRADMKVEFQLADNDMIRQRFFSGLWSQAIKNAADGCGLGRLARQRCRSWSSVQLKLCLFYWLTSDHPLYF